MKYFFLLILFFTQINCASYWHHRKKDAMDIFSVGVETPVYGAGVRLGPLPIGFYFAGGETEMGKRDLGTGVGMRGGEIGEYHSQQLVFGILGGESFHSGEAIKDNEGNTVVDKNFIPVTGDERANLKSYKMRYLTVFLDPVDERKKRKKERVRRILIEEWIAKGGDPSLRDYIPPPEAKPYGYPKSFLWQLDIFLGVYGGVRFGFNIAEFLDFLVGFTSLDLLDDDILDEKENKIPVPGKNEI